MTKSVVLSTLVIFFLLSIASIESTSRCDLISEYCARSNSNCPSSTNNILHFGSSSTASFSDYDVISYGDLGINSGDVQRRAAVRDNFIANSSGVSIGDQINPAFGDSTLSFALVVGRNAVFINGEVFPIGANQENIFVGGTFTGADNLKPRVTGNCSTSGCLDPDFANSLTYYTGVSQVLENLAVNVDVSVDANSGVASLTCRSSNASFYTVGIRTSDFNKITSYSVSGCASGALWVFNIFGTTNFVRIDGVTLQQKIIYNIIGSKSIYSQTLIYGTILAPLSTFNQTGGTIFGTIIAKNIPVLIQSNRCINNTTTNTTSTSTSTSTGATGTATGTATGVTGVATTGSVNTSTSTGATGVATTGASNATSTSTGVTGVVTTGKSNATSTSTGATATGATATGATGAVTTKGAGVTTSRICPATTSGKVTTGKATSTGGTATGATATGATSTAKATTGSITGATSTAKATTGATSTSKATTGATSTAKATTGSVTGATSTSKATTGSITGATGTATGPLTGGVTTSSCPVCPVCPTTGIVTGTVTGTPSQPNSTCTNPNCPFVDYDNECAAEFTLGSAQQSFKDYDVVVFGDFNANTGDVEGRLLAFGSVTLGNGFSIGAKVDSSANDSVTYALIAGSLNFTSGAVYPDGSSGKQENIFVAGAFSVPSFLTSRVTGRCPNGTTNCLDSIRDSARDCYDALQEELAGNADNVQFQLMFSTLFINCTSNTPSDNTYRMTVSTSIFNQITTYNLNNCNADAKWIITITATSNSNANSTSNSTTSTNTTGNSVLFRGGSFPATPANVLYNVLGSNRTIEVTTGVNGAILSPRNHLNQPGGVVNGKVIVGSAFVLQINKPVCPNTGVCPTNSTSTTGSGNATSSGSVTGTGSATSSGSVTGTAGATSASNLRRAAADVNVNGATSVSVYSMWLVVAISLIFLGL